MSFIKRNWILLIVVGLVGWFVYNQIRVRVQIKNFVTPTGGVVWSGF